MPEPSELPDDMKWIDELQTFDPEQQLKAVGDYVDRLLASPEGSQLLLTTLGSTTMPQGIAKEMAREIILQLTPSSLQQLTQEGYLQKQSSYEVISLLIVRSFAGVLVVSCLALTIAPFFKSNIDTTATQMLLTVFTTSVGFLSGFFAPSPGSQQPPLPIVRPVEPRVAGQNPQTSIAQLNNSNSST